MAEKATCPEFKDILDTDRCTENFGGVSRILYAFRKSELAAKLVPEKNKYPAMAAKTTFKTGKGLYKYMCKSGENGFSYESLGPGKGFKQTLNDVIEACDAESAEAMRAFNNTRDIAFVQKDGDKGILIYDEDENFEFASGGIKGDTGKKKEDDRTTTLEGSLSGTRYGYYEIAEPEGGWDSLLASAAVGG